ncbi:MAG TPA: glycoside hydrolase family 15 protein [Opitutaceae bacterium]|jgi:GH15 family glucan-1,4-alpha-glucosidase
MKIEDYAVIGDMHTAALVGANGSIDWLCLPKFGSDACFAALLGIPDNGHWRIAPKDEKATIKRAYLENTLVLETEYTTESGTAKVIDFMPVDRRDREVIRIVEGVSGEVAMAMRLVIRFDYGRTVPWVRHLSAEGLIAVAGPNALTLRTAVKTEGEDLSSVAEFTARAGERTTFSLSWHPSHLRLSAPESDEHSALSQTVEFWRSWALQCKYRGPWRTSVIRSLITLKALTYDPTGGIMAAATTSLPEHVGGVRNWDYRFCWLRDATFSLFSFMAAGYVDEARAWSEWLLRAVAGDPSQLQIVYGAAGERQLMEFELRHLIGYEDSRPVRVGNAAAEQFQLDVYGEVMDAMHVARAKGIKTDEDSWHLQRHLVDFVRDHWMDPDEGIWEIRGPRRHFTHSKVMAWVAIDRAVKAVEQFGLDGPASEWSELRTRIHDDICSKGFNPERNAFTQFYGSKELDASLLMIPLVGFLPATDPRFVSTLELIEEELVVGGFVQRYETSVSGRVDGLPKGEGTFLPCSFWLADCLYLMGRATEAGALFERLLAVKNDLGLLAEEYDPTAKRLLGNYPQAFSHVCLVNTAYNLNPQTVGPAEVRSVT